MMIDNNTLFYILMLLMIFSGITSIVFLCMAKSIIKEKLF